MAEIIAASGLSAGSVYRYFPSKKALIIATVTTSLIELQSFVTPPLDAKPPPVPRDMMHAVMVGIDRSSRRDGGELAAIALLGWSEAQRNDELWATT